VFLSNCIAIAEYIPLS